MGSPPLDRPMAMQAAAPAPVTYLGKHCRGVDKSRRVMLPSEWRGDGWPVQFTLLVWQPPQCDHLLALPPERWAKMLGYLGDNSLSNQPGAVLERFVSSNSYPRGLDGYGRLPIPDEA